VTEEGTSSASRGRWIAVVVLFAGAVGLYLVTRRPPPPAPPQDEHRDSLAGMQAAYKAMMDAPEGATLCESAWNAFDALQRKRAELGVAPMTEKQGDRDSFLAVCKDFSEAEQRCLVPKYRAAHGPECAPMADRMWAETDGGRKNLATVFGKRLDG